MQVEKCVCSKRLQPFHLGFENLGATHVCRALVLEKLAAHRGVALARYCGLPLRAWDHLEHGPQGSSCHRVQVKRLHGA